MKFKWILIIVLMQVFTAEVLAMAQAIRTEGTMEVTKSFVVKGTTAKGMRATGEKKVLPVGKQKISVGSHTSEEFMGNCVFLLGCKGDRAWVRYVSINGVSFAVKSTPLKDGTIAYYAKDTKQSFNMFLKRTESERKGNYTNGYEQCEVPLYRNSGGYYNSSTVYGIGSQLIHRYERIVLTKFSVKISDAASNKVIAVYNGSQESRTSEIDSAGECVLNKDN